MYIFLSGVVKRTASNIKKIDHGASVIIVCIEYYKGYEGRTFLRICGITAMPYVLVPP